MCIMVLKNEGTWSTVICSRTYPKWLVGLAGSRRVQVDGVTGAGGKDLPELMAMDSHKTVPAVAVDDARHAVQMDN